MPRKKKPGGRTRSRIPSRAKYATDDSEPERCHAARKRDGARCEQPVVKGQWVCRYHGGLSTGAKTKKTGHFSGVLNRMRESYEEGLADREALYSLDETLSMMQVLTERAVVRAEECDSPKLRATGFALLKEALAAMDSGDGKRAGDKFRALYDLLEKGVSEDATLDALTKAVEKFAARKEAAWGVRLKAAEAMNKGDVTMLLAKMIDIMADEADADVAGRVAKRVAGEVFHVDDEAGWDYGIRPDPPTADS